MCGVRCNCTMYSAYCILHTIYIIIIKPLYCDLCGLTNQQEQIFPWKFSLQTSLNTRKPLGSLKQASIQGSLKQASIQGSLKEASNKPQTSFNTRKPQGSLKQASRKFFWKFNALLTELLGHSRRTAHLVTSNACASYFLEWPTSFALLQIGHNSQGQYIPLKNDRQL